MRLRLALLRAAFSRNPSIECRKSAWQESYDAAPRKWELPEPTRDADGRLLVRCLSSGRLGAVLDEASPSHVDLRRVLWDGNTGGVWARAENLSVVIFPHPATPAPN